MATKNFSSSLANKVFCIVLLTAFVSGCASLKTREDVDVEKEGKTQTSQTRTGGIQQGTTTTQPPVAPTPLPAPEPYVGSEPPKVGLILGPGGLKTFAHIGVLKEIARAKLPIHAVVGLEWGSILAGMYAMQGQVNEVEWKAFKLREEDIPSSGLLTKAIQSEKIEELNAFLSTVFGTQKIEKAKLEYGCPTFNLKTEKLAWWNRGEFRDSLRGCIAYPPYYKDSNGWMAAPFAIEEAAQYLRAKGATLVIYVNALGGELFNSQLENEHYAEYVLWSEARRQASRKSLPGVNLVINVNTAEHGMTDFQGRRQMVEAGSKSAHDVINKIVTQYGY